MSLKQITATAKPYVRLSSQPSQFLKVKGQKESCEDLLCG